MRALGRVAALCVPLLALEGAGARSPAATPTKTHTITMENVGYTPAHLTVHQGDRIVWVNKDLFPHTATATDKAFDSGSIAVSKSWTYVARKAGTFTYTCSFHPTMKGEIEVQ
jgi:plastocyanin